MTTVLEASHQTHILLIKLWQYFQQEAVKVTKKLKALMKLLYYAEPLVCSFKFL